jgi:hypothetical protein
VLPNGIMDLYCALIIPEQGMRPPSMHEGGNA